MRDNLTFDWRVYVSRPIRSSLTLVCVLFKILWFSCRWYFNPIPYSPCSIAASLSAPPLKLYFSCAYYTASYAGYEITGYPCSVIGSQGYDLFMNPTIFCSELHLFLSQWEWDSKTKQPIRLQGFFKLTNHIAEKWETKKPLFGKFGNLVE